MARRDEGAYPPAVCDRGATKPGGLFPENPPGGGSFVYGLRWLGRYSPLRGCSSLAALATAKIPRRRTSRNFQTRSQAEWPHATQTGKYLVASVSIPKRFGRLWRVTNEHQCGGTDSFAAKERKDFALSASNGERDGVRCRKSFEPLMSADSFQRKDAEGRRSSTTDEHRWTRIRLSRICAKPD